MTDTARKHAQRPLSPHLSIYKPQISSVLSILHRITGFGLYLGLLLAALWIISSGFTPHHEGGIVASFFSTFIGKLFLFLWTLALFYHACNGIRHLFWDIGKGYDLAVMTKSGYAVLGSAVILTLITWIIALV